MIHELKKIFNDFDFMEAKSAFLFQFSLEHVKTFLNLIGRINIYWAQDALGIVFAR